MRHQTGLPNNGKRLILFSTKPTHSRTPQGTQSCSLATHTGKFAPAQASGADGTVLAQAQLRAAVPAMHPAALLRRLHSYTVVVPHAALVERQASGPTSPSTDGTEGQPDPAGHAPDADNFLTCNRPAQAFPTHTWLGYRMLAYVTWMLPGCWLFATPTTPGGP